MFTTQRYTPRRLVGFYDGTNSADILAAYPWATTLTIVSEEDGVLQLQYGSVEWGTLFTLHAGDAIFIGNEQNHFEMDQGYTIDGVVPAAYFAIQWSLSPDE